MPKGNYGSKKKLNWQEPQYEEKAVKSVSHADRVDKHSRAGTPPTRRGAYNGVLPRFSPAAPPELTPPVYINKAVLQPVKYGPGGKKEFERKRDPSGRFAPAQQSGTQSTADEDEANEQRQVRLREARSRDAIRDAKQQASRAGRGEKTKPTKTSVGGGENPKTKKTSETKKAMPSLPGNQQADSLNSANDAASNAIGATNSGFPIFDDPYNSQHQSFTPADHQEAADLNNQMAQQAQQTGDMAGATKFANNASVHSDLANENQAPGDRFLDNLMGQPAQPGGGMGPSTDPGMMNGQDPGMVPDQQANMDPGMGAGDPMQQDPMQQDPSMGAGDPMQQQGMQPGYEQFANPMGAVPNNFSADDLQNFVAPGSQEPVQDFTDPNQAPPMNADMNKPLAPGPQSGPTPGMVHTGTGEPTGPQTPEGQDMGAGAGMGVDQQTGQGLGAEGPEEVDISSLMEGDQTFDPFTMEVEGEEEGGEGLDVGGDEGMGDEGMDDGGMGDEEGGLDLLGEESPDGDMNGEDVEESFNEESSGQDAEDVNVPESNAGAPGPPTEPDREGEDDKKEKSEDAEKALARAIDTLRRFG